MKIGWIGLGKMGMPMSKRVAGGGHTIIAFARNAASAGKAKEAGYAAVSSMAELAGASEVVISSIPDDAALHEAVAAKDALASHLSRGQTYIDTSTVSPEASAEVARMLAAKG